MHRFTGWLLAFLLLLVLPMKVQSAPDLIGQWQGTMNAGATLRVVFKFTRSEDGSLTGQLYSIDQGAKPITITDLVFTGDTLKLTVLKGQGAELKFSADGQSLQGNYLSNGFSIPLTLARATQATAWAIPVATAADTTPHKIQMVTVADNVQLEVVDWGGSGRPLVFLAGLGATAHAFDTFAPRFTNQYHVYGITRRGYGASSKPDPAVVANYRADRLGDDVLAVIAALKLDRPVLVGWSLGGEEMSSVATRHPDAVAGLVYLDAADTYAFYTPGYSAGLKVSVSDLVSRLDRINQNLLAPGNEALIDRIVATDLPQLAADLRATKVDLEAMRKLMNSTPQASSPQAPLALATAFSAGMQKYGAVKVPVLSFFHETTIAADAPANLLPALKFEIRQEDEMVRAYRKGNPTAKVVRIAGARHDIFVSNPDEVAREMDSFLAALPQRSDATNGKAP